MVDLHALRQHAAEERQEFGPFLDILPSPNGSYPNLPSFIQSSYKWSKLR